MEILQETLFKRLLARYERVFGNPPPFKAATLDDAIDYLRTRLGEGPAGDAAAQNR